MKKNLKKYAILFTKDNCEPIAFACEQVWETKEGHLLIGLGQERTNYGSAFVQSIWFKRPVYLKILGSNDSTVLQYSVNRCHITGSLFQEMLLEFRLLYPQKDLNIVWEVIPAEFDPQKKTFNKKVFPPLSEVSSPFEWDCHLDFNK